MNRRTMIKMLEILEEKYPKQIVADELMQKLRLKDIDGEFSKILTYLRATNKTIVFLPESRVGKTQRQDFMKIDEITINPQGIDFLAEIKRIELDKSRNYLLLDTTIVLTQVAIIGIALTIYEKFNLNLSNPSIEIPWLLSVVIMIIFFVFSMLMIFKVCNILFSKDSWRGDTL